MQQSGDEGQRPEQTLWTPGRDDLCQSRISGLAGEGKVSDGGVTPCPPFQVSLESQKSLVPSYPDVLASQDPFSLKFKGHRTRKGRGAAPGKLSTLW